MNNTCDNLKKVPKIPRGNDFKFFLHLVEEIVVGHHQVEQREVQGTVSDITVYLYNANGDAEEIERSSASNGTHSYSIDTNNNVMISFYKEMPVGKYGIEVLFKVTNKGITLDRRFFAPPGKAFWVVESTSEGFIPSDKVLTYEIAADLGLGTLVDLSGYPTNEQLASALSGKVDKVNGKGLSANDFTDEYKDALDDIMENGSAFSTGEKVGEVGITDEATQDSEDLITSGAVYSMMNAISSGAGVSASASPSVIYKNTATNVSVSATMKNSLLASSIQIKDGSTVEHSGTNTNSISKTLSLNLSADKTYNIVATYQGMTFNASVKVSARYPIYVGMGTSASAVAVSANRLTARTSASGTYTKSATANGQHFYILAPSDVLALSNFTMGGAPFAMTSTTQTINGISYNVYESGATYNSGTQVNVTAS